MASDGAWRARRHLFVAGAEPLVTMNAMMTDATMEVTMDAAMMNVMMRHVLEMF